MGTITVVAAAVAWLAGAPQLHPEPELSSAELLYGRVVTTAGDELEGFLRWDRNETHWFDLLEGRAFIAPEHALEAERLDEELRRLKALERSVSLPGIRITWEEDDDVPPESTPAAVRFGHVRSIEPLERGALLTLETGERVELASSSSDLGRSFRGLVVEDASRGAVEIEWEDLARVDFMQAPADRPPPRERRLHGTLHTRDGSEWTGFVAWSLDESLPSHTLDGEGRDGEMVRIAFADVASIARESRRSARVRLRSGEEIVLTDTNDVGSDIPGIEITDPSFGRAAVAWDVFASLDFHPPNETPVEGQMEKAAYTGGASLRGTVVASDGRRIAGLIRWDNHKERTWEVLDAWTYEGADLVVGIELGLVRSIERVDEAFRVALDGGRTFMLQGSEERNDLGPSNRGIFVTNESGETTLVRWRDFASATFDP